MCVPDSVSVCIRLMPAVLQALQERKDLLSNEVYLLSAVTALQRTTETLPHFISPYLEGTISQVRYTQQILCVSFCLAFPPEALQLGVSISFFQIKYENESFQGLVQSEE